MVGKKEEPNDGGRLAGRLIGREGRKGGKRQKTKKNEEGGKERSGSLRHDL